MRVLSLGAGVQSSTLLLMAREGELELDAAIFADTQWEPAAVYRHLEWLESVSPVPLERVTVGDIREVALHGWPGRRMFPSLPLHVRNRQGEHGMLRRQCTLEFKVKPIRRRLRELGATAASPIALLMGISLDEYERMRQADVRYVEHVYPLVERRLTRHDCQRWLIAHGYPVPPKSSCIGCPYHGNAYWRGLRDESPVEWADAVDFDASVRRLSRIDVDTYLHADLVPLAEVDLRSPQDRGQLDLFGAECSGVCGV